MSCTDFQEWLDSAGNGCEYYQAALNGCQDSSTFEVDGIGADQACCFCGGGFKPLKALGDLWRLNVSVAASMVVVRSVSAERLGEGYGGIECLPWWAGDYRVRGWKYLRLLGQLCSM